MPATAVKRLGANRVGGYLVVWGSPAQRDLQGEYFSKSTDFELGWFDRRPILYQHGLDGNIKTSVIGYIDTLKTDEIGLWAEGDIFDVSSWEAKQLKLNAAYLQAVNRLVERGALGWSSGSMPHLVEVDRNGHIRRWPLVEGSLTPSPAEPRRTNVSTIKSAYEALGLDVSALKLDEATATEGETASVAPAEPTPTEATNPQTPPDRDEGISAEGDVTPPAADAPPPDDAAPPSVEEAAPDHPTELEPSAEVETPEVAATEADATERRRLNVMEQMDAIINAVLQVLGYSDVTDEQRNEIMEGVRGMMENRVGAPMRSVTAANITAAFADATFRTKVQELIKAKMVGALNPADIANQFAPHSTAGTGGASRVDGGANFGVNGQPPASSPQISNMKTKYDRANLDVRDLAYWHTITQLMGKHEAMRFPDEAYRQLVVEAETAVKTGDIQLFYEDDHNGMKAMNVANQISRHAAAVKDNELVHTGNTGFGAEWIADLWSSELWRDERDELVVAREFQQVDMPSDPYNMPIEGVDPEMELVAETTNAAQLVLTNAATSSVQKIGTNYLVMETDKFMLRISISAEQEEDSIIPTLAEARRKVMRVFDETRDEVILNADSATTGNVNLDGGTPGAKKAYMTSKGEGLVKTCFTLAAAPAAGVTPIIDAAGLPTLALMRSLRFAGLESQYRRQISNLRYIVDTQVEGSLLGIPEFLTVDKMGAQATVLTGMIGSIDGIPVLVSSELKPSAVNGKVSNTAGDNVKGRALLVYKPWHKVGFRRNVRITSEFYAAMDAHMLVLSARMGQKQRDGHYVSMLRNISVGA